MKQPVHVILADDHHIVVEGLKEILKTVDAMVVAGVADNGMDLLHVAQALPTPPDLAILDINMPKMDGLRCTRELKRVFPAIKVLILTMYHDRAFINEMINAGADGCILKTKGTQELREAITRILQDRSYFDSIPEFKKESTPANVSDRELDIIRLIVKGMNSTEIAEQLFISEHTVKTHRKNIFKKLQVNNVVQLTGIAISRGWSS